MSKKIVYFITSASWLSLASLVLATGAAQIPDPLKGATFCSVLTSIGKAVGTVVGSLGAIMFIVAGIFYLTSAGSPERIGVAKKTLIYAIAGLVIGLSANMIVDFVKKSIGASGGNC